MIWALHGAVGMAADWRHFAASLLAEFGEVRRLDLWRFLDCCPMSLDEVGRALAEEIKRVDPEPVLVGYSMGGRLALHALLSDPGLWKAAVIISAHPGLRDESDRVQRREKDAEWSALALKGEWPDFLEQWNGQGVLVGAGDMPDRSQLKSRRTSVARSFIDWSLGVQKDLSRDFNTITCPVLWLTGESDVKFTQIAREVVGSVPGGEHQTIPQCGHRIPWEKPREFASSCVRFLQQLP